MHARGLDSEQMQSVGWVTSVVLTAEQAFNLLPAGTSAVCTGLKCMESLSLSVWPSAPSTIISLLEAIIITHVRAGVCQITPPSGYMFDG